MQIARPTSRAIPRVAAPSAAIKTMRALTRARYSVFVERAGLSSSMRSSLVNIIRVAYFVPGSGALAAEAAGDREIASPTRPFLAVALETACASIDQSPPHGGGPGIGPARTRFREAMSPVDARSRGF